MRPGNAFITAIQLLFATCVLFLGIFVGMLPWSSHNKKFLIHFVQGEPLNLVMAGGAIFCIGIALMIGFYALYRRSYYRIKMGEGDLLIDSHLIKSYVEDYWQKLFPKHHVESSVFVNRDTSLEIVADLPFVERPQQEKMLYQIECDLHELFKKTLGYKKSFRLVVSFSHRETK